MVLIDIEMPESCMKCPIKQHHKKHNWDYRCGIARIVFDENFKIRHFACPLIEVKTAERKNKQIEVEE